MKQVSTIFILTTLLPKIATAANVFDGTWKQQAQSAKMAGKPLSIIAKDGVFTCASCLVPYHVKADGTDQPVAGQIGYDSISVKLVDDRTIVRTEKMKGTIVGHGTMTIDPASDRAASDWASTQNGTTSTRTMSLRRVSPAPVGAHPLSGEWMPTGLSHASDNAMLMTFKTNQNTLEFSSPEGLSYAAGLDGAPAAFHGDPRVQTVAVKRDGPSKIVETDMREGKMVTTVTMTVAPDGKTMAIVYRNPLLDHTTSFTALKQ